MVRTINSKGKAIKLRLKLAFEDVLGIGRA